jgi:hypothetical protein
MSSNQKPFMNKNETSKPVVSSEMVRLWRERATTLRHCAKLVKPNRELSKALAWMGDAFEQCADEVNPPQPNVES